MKEDQASSEPKASGKAAQPRQNFITRFLDKYWRARDNESKMGPIPRTGLALLLVVAGVAISEAYQWGKSAMLGPDEYLVQIKEEQDKSFARLQDSLNSLGSSIGGDNRGALSELKGAVAEIKQINNSLISRLSLAKSENERLAKVVGVPGGLDLVLSSDTGLPLDAMSHVGVQRIASNGAYVSVASKDGSTTPAFLRSGESIAFTGASGRSCRVTLVSVDPRSAVSLASRCA